MRPFMKLTPDERAASAYTLAYEAYYAQGIRGVLFDIDNTLVRHGEPETVKLFERLRGIGLVPFVLSNNEINRVRSFAETVGADYLYKAGKPAKHGYLEACGKMGIEPSQALAVGDQIYTDIWGAKRSGIRAVLVEPIDPSKEEIQIRFKRLLERPVLAAKVAKKEGI